MKYEIKADEDETFKVIPFGEQFAASDGERVEIAPTPEKAVEQLQEVVAPPQRMPKAVPINNPVDSSHHWFVGTSWSTKQ